MILIKICIVIIISLIIINTQIRLTNKIFVHWHERNKLLRYSLLLGSFTTIALLAYSKYEWFFYSLLWIDKTVLFNGYIGTLWTCVSLLFVWQKKRWLALWSATITILGLVWWLTYYAAWWVWLGLVLTKATWEEILKTIGWHTLLPKISERHSGDMILFGILAWLWFALFENLVYFAASHDIWQFITRSITTSLLHGIFTGLIWYVAYKNSHHSYLGYIIAYICWIGIHTIYNLTLQSSFAIIGGIAFMLWGYFLLSYLLYKSDRVYLAPQWENA